jgi:GNAT superfamily N-acetyltransferase
MPRKPTNNTIAIREILTADEWAALFPLIKQLNPEITKAKFKQYLSAMLPLGYRCIAAYRGGKMIGACGIWAGTRFWCGDYIEVDNLVVDRKQRNGGVGKLLMGWVEKEAKRRKCDLVMADSYTHNTASHRFYFRENYIIKGFCFVKELT